MTSPRNHPGTVDEVENILPICLLLNSRGNFADEILFEKGVNVTKSSWSYNKNPLLVRSFRPKKACFNCDEEHDLRECPLPRDYNRINQRKREFMNAKAASQQPKLQLVFVLVV